MHRVDLDRVDPPGAVAVPFASVDVGEREDDTWLMVPTLCRASEEAARAHGLLEHGGHRGKGVLVARAYGDDRIVSERRVD